MSSSISFICTHTGALSKANLSQRQQMRTGKKDASAKGGFSLFSEDKLKAILVNKTELDTMVKARRDAPVNNTAEVLTTAHLAGSKTPLAKHSIKAASVPKAWVKSFSAAVSRAAQATPVEPPALPAKRNASASSNSSTASRAPSSTFSTLSTQSNKSWNLIASGKPAAAKPVVTFPSTKPSTTPAVVPGQLQKSSTPSPPPKKSLVVGGTTAKPSDGFIIVAKKQKNGKAPCANQVITVSKKTAPLKPTTKHLLDVRGVQTVKLAVPKKETPLAPQNADGSPVHSKCDFPAIDKSAATFPEKPAESVVKFLKPTKASIIPHIPTSTVPNSKGSTTSKNAPFAATMIETKPVQASTTPVVVSDAPPESVLVANSPKKATKKSKKSAKIAKKFTKASNATAPETEQSTSLVPGPTEVDASTSRIKSSSTKGSVSENSGHPKKCDIPSLPKETETATGADVPAPKAVTAAIISNDEAAPAIPANFSPLESLFCLNHGMPGIRAAFDEISVTKHFIEVPVTYQRKMEQPEVKNDETFTEVISINLTKTSFDYAAMDSRFCLHHSIGDDDEEFPATDLQDAQELVQDEKVQLGADVQCLCEIAHLELLVHEQSTDKVSRDDMVALQQVSAYGHEIVVEDVHIDLATRVEPPSISKPTAVAKDISTLFPERLSQPDGETKVKKTATPPKLRNQRLYMGTVTVANFLDTLTRKKPHNNKYTKKQITQVFTSFSTRELDSVGLEPLDGTSKTRHILRSPILQHKVRVGRTKLVDFLKSMTLEDDAATLDAVAMACVQAAKAEKTFQRSGVGKEVARVLGRLE